MRDLVEIRSARDGSILLFLNPKRHERTAVFNYWLVRLSEFVVTAEVRVYDNHPWTLGSFFRELAVNWRGWQGTKRWASVEGQLELRATSDSLGHIFLRVLLRDAPDVQDWRVETTLLLEAGQLDAIAGAAEGFFGADPAA